MGFNDNEDFGGEDEQFDFFFSDPDANTIEIGESTHEVILPESAGSFTVLSSTAYLTKTRLKAYSAFGFAAFSLAFTCITPFLTFGGGWLPYLMVLMGSVTLFFLTRGMLYLRVSHNWEKVLAATQDSDPVVEYLALRALGDTFAGEEGYKVVPTLGYMKWTAGRRMREEDRNQRRVDAIGVAIDAYSAAASQAKHLGDEAACREVLHVVLNLISALQLPRFSKAVHIDNLDSLELAIILYMISSDPVRKRQEQQKTDDSFFDFEANENPFDQSFLPPPDPLVKKNKKGSQYAETDIHFKFKLSNLFGRAAEILCQKENFDMAFHCHVNAAEYSTSQQEIQEATKSYIDAGFVACLADEFDQVEAMLQKSQPGLAVCGVEEAQRWWILSAMVADHWGDIGRCEEATLNASLLDTQRHF